MGRIFLWRPPRTAGSSIDLGLRELGIVADRRHPEPLKDWDVAADYIACKHYTPAELIGRSDLTEEEVFSARNLLCVRNIWDRLVSTFALLRTTGWRRPGWGHWRDAEDSRFAEYVAWATSPVRETEYHPRNFQCQPATDWLFVKGRRVPFCVLGRFEDLPAYWRAVREVFGVNGGELPLTNCRAHKPYREYYTPELRDQVAKFYAAEIAEFGYAF